MKYLETRTTLILNRSNGTWYTAANYRFRQLKTTACKNCPVREKCTASKRNGKIVQRSEYTDSLERNKQRVKENKELYRQRQAIVEHPYGTIKRQWGFSYVSTKKTKQRASADTCPVESILIYLEASTGIS